ncbi:MAG: cytochrome C family, partial [Geobacteraceae bacterium]
MNRQQNIRRMSLKNLIWLFFITILIIPVNRSEAAIQCYDCHGTRSTGDYRPVDDTYRNVSSGGFRGNHRSHLPTPVNNATGSAPCAKCHPGSDKYSTGHRDGRIMLAFNINSSPVAARYINRTSALSNWSSAFLQTPTPTLGTCSSVNCHFETATPQWGSPRLAAPGGCNNVCHGAPPNDGSHGGHFDAFSSASGRLLENICVKCHSDHSTFAHVTSAGKRK